METITLNEADVAALCGLGETHSYDRKSRRIQPSRLTKPMSAFANADGGDMYIGIEDDGTCRIDL